MHSRFVHFLATLAVILTMPGVAQEPATSRGARIAKGSLLRAPLPEGTEVARIAASNGTVWFAGFDRTEEPPEAVVYSWSAAGVRKLQLPSLDGAVQFLDLAADRNGTALLVTSAGVLQLDEVQAGWFESLQEIRVRGVAGTDGYWAIADGDKVYYLAGPFDRLVRREGIRGEVTHWAATASGELWLAAQRAGKSVLYEVRREQTNVTEVALPILASEPSLVTALFADSAGMVWVSLANGTLLRYSAGAFDRYDESTGYPNVALSAIAEDQLGNYYLSPFASDEEPTRLWGIPSSARARVQLDFFRFEMEGFTGQIRTLSADPRGGLWVAIGAEGAYRLQGSKSLPWPRGWAQDSARAGAGTQAKAVAPQERFSTVASGIEGMTGGKFTLLNSLKGLVNDAVSSIVSDSQGNIYFTTGYSQLGGLPPLPGGGVSRWDHHTITNYTTANGLASNTVQASAFDAANNVVWFGTSNGLSRFHVATGTFTNFLPAVLVTDIKVDGSGSLWVATWGHGLYRITAATGAIAAQFTAATTGGRLGSNNVTSVALDGFGNVWVGTDGGSLSSYSIAGNTWTNHSSSLSAIAGSASARVFRVETDLSNNVWIAIPFAGVVRRSSGGVYSKFDRSSTPPLGGNTDNVIYALHRDRSGNLWFGYAYNGEIPKPEKVGVTFLAASQVNASAPAFVNYSASANGFPYNIVISIYGEDQSTVWFGGSGQGVWRLGGPFDAPGWPQRLQGMVYHSSPVLADLDGDQDLEVIVGDTAGWVYAFRPDGSLFWKYDTRNAIPVGTPAGAMTVQSSPAVADVDGDGEPEVVVGLGGQALPGIGIGQGGVLILNSNGTFKRILYTQDITDSANRGAPQDGFREGVLATPVLANVDDDPEPEILVGAFDNLFYGWNADGTTIFARDNDGDGRFDEDFLGDSTPYTPFDSSDDFPGIRLVDDDSNGDTDEGHPADDDEDGLIDEDYPEFPFNATDTLLTGTVVTDLLGNGQPAIIFGTDYSGTPPFSRGGVLRVLDRTGSPLPGFPKGNLEQVIWSSPAVVDLDGDGKLEIVHGSGLDLSTVGDTPADSLVGRLVYAWRNDGSPFIAGSNGKLADTEGRSYASFAVGDLDNDGHPELVIATTPLMNKQGQYTDSAGNVISASNAIGQMLYAFRRDGSLLPGFPVRPYTANRATNLVGSPVLADVNADGFLDIVLPVGAGIVVFDRTGRAVPGMGIYENLQEDNFPGEITSTPAVGDIDLDGRLELVWSMGTGSGTTGIVRIVKLGAVNATAQRSWPCFLRTPQRNAVFDVILGQVRAVDAGGHLRLTAQAFAGRSPIASVTVDLSSIGGAPNFALRDDGTGGDPVASDGYFTGQISSASISPGRYQFGVTATDQAGRISTHTLFFVKRTSGARLSEPSAGTVAFGSVGRELTEQRHVSFMNIGDAPVQVTSITSSNPQFRVQYPSLPAMLAPGEVMTIRLLVQPSSTADGTISGMLTIRSNDSVNPVQTVQLLATVVPVNGGITLLHGPAITFEPRRVGTFQDLYYGISSSGAEPLVIRSVEFGHPAFSLYKPANPQTPRVIAPGTTVPFAVRFRPASAGSFSSYMKLTTNDPANPTVTITLNGTGLGGSSGCTYTLSPGVIHVAATGTAGSFTLTTAGTNCGWTATSNRSWAQVYPLSGTGNSTITYTIFPNYTSSPRSATFTVGTGTITINQAASTENPDRRLIGQMYFSFFGRIPSQGEVDFMETALVSGLARADFVMNFFNSLEFNNAGRFIAGLYVGILGRDAEYGGWLFNRNALATGVVNHKQLVDSFLNSVEYQLNNPSLSDADFVKQMYRQILLREPTQAEVDFHVSALAGGISRTQMATNFLNSTEFRISTGPRLTTFLLYACLFLRDASGAEFNTTVNAISSGTPVRDLVDNFLNSSEFAALLQ